MSMNLLRRYATFLNGCPKQPTKTKISAVTSKCGNDECKKVEPHSGALPEILMQRAWITVKGIGALGLLLVSYIHQP